MGTTEVQRFLAERLYHNSGIPLHIYRDNQCVLKLPGQEDAADVLRDDAALYDELYQIALRNENPVLYMEEHAMFFGTFKDSEDFFYFWGPVSREEMSEQKLVSYYHKHRTEGKRIPIIKTSLEMLSNILSIAFFGCCGQCVTEEDIFLEWQEKETGDIVKSTEMEHYQLDKSEMNRAHGSVEYENQLMAAVEQGDVTTMKQLLHVDSFDMDRIGVVAKNKLKQMEYLCVTLAYMVSRAAVRGGMTQEFAYDLSDVYLQKLEKCKTVEEMGMLFAKLQMDYTERVRQIRAKKKGNIYVERAKDFIAQHLRKEFQIGEMADALGVSRSYLSKIFAEQEGITIRQYIIEERLEHAANMLKFTDYSVSVIADYFCFATQSHFGKQFKAHFGMTPREYRQQNPCVKKFY